MRRHEVKGTITVFLSLLSVIFLSLICTVIESARVAGARAQTANITDMGNYSVFSEYEKKLLEKYEIFSIDGSYGTGEFSIDKVNERMKQFMNRNLPTERSGVRSGGFDPWRLQIDNCEIEEYALLTDNNGEAFYQQVVSYMKNTAVSGAVGKLYQYHHDAQTSQSNQGEYDRRKRSSDQEMKQLEQQEEEKKKELQNQAVTDLTVTEPGTVEEIKKENPLRALSRLRRKSTLDIVCGGKQISEKRIKRHGVPSLRKLQKGSMEIKKENSGLTSDLFFREYLLDHFPNYLDREHSGKLDYQIEYIIGGKRTDRGNLSATVQKLLLLREGANYLYCVRDEAMSAEAGGLAALLIGWTCIPELIPVMKHALLLGWAYGESLLDVKTLMDGGKVELFKMPGSWRLSLEQLGNIGELLELDGSGQQNGMGYQDYLRILLNLQGTSTQQKRALDLIELDISSQPGLSNFQADHCVVGIKEQTDWVIHPVFWRVPAVFLNAAPEMLSVQVQSRFEY